MGSKANQYGLCLLLGSINMHVSRSYLQTSFFTKETNYTTKMNIWFTLKWKVRRDEKHGDMGHKKTSKHGLHSIIFFIFPFSLLLMLLLIIIRCKLWVSISISSIVSRLHTFNVHVGLSRSVSLIFLCFHTRGDLLFMHMLEKYPLSATK